jgi:8-oxo-dGTP diphosphatase
MRIAINLACIRGNEILLVEKKGVWILPGGKPLAGENDHKCLERELSEELPDASFSLAEHYEDFEGKTPNTGDMLTAKVYFGTFQGGEITVAAEISDSAWVHKNDLSAYKLSAITEDIIEYLIDDNAF